MNRRQIWRQNQRLQPRYRTCSFSLVWVNWSASLRYISLNCTCNKIRGNTPHNPATVFHQNQPEICSFCDVFSCLLYFVLHVIKLIYLFCLVTSTSRSCEYLLLRIYIIHLLLICVLTDLSGLKYSLAFSNMMLFSLILIMLIYLPQNKTENGACAALS